MGNETDPTFGKVSLGTTIISVSFNGGVILAADSRTSSGNYIGNRATDKITPLSDKVYVLRSGSAADTQAIASYVQLFVAQHQAESGEEVRVRTVANMIRQLAYQNKDMLQAGMIVAGWDSEKGGQVFGVPLGGTLLPLPYAIGGSGSAYISGFCERNFRTGMSEEEALEFIRCAVKLAIARDASSGGCIRTVIITKEGVKRHFLPGENIPATYGEIPVAMALDRPNVQA
uniref:Proteasome subunit beta n=1 Tax=Polytomella parva TaxID=51329 RepID=A0A7S0VE54_9CHLO|mmetsp:Transcript_31278/g.56773  ORF Transcript_31278/g.56773 Transcript_31278/m.56773 type:complete len:230 (+) Transcript_31278:141-830(+)|eukprot:CAMPEP_0175059424 /NCGR_PEP_ID=MMETSP0052_2-20121109/12426_1 /TAXON_ID=51329 ORGANISM="Polytomella parva, Strain SAG 63-3" /NCGR_SAMPLE_ID=MMETSP0052_2 /ASSEMBLY_ACC=CAM_ASM_000194 /LENGTH=229 /DNA_ID=CAMNT_0016324975 /DNA_START=90 /DNA_END=779 /DNA_ORIENTATION=-